MPQPDWLESMKPEDIQGANLRKLKADLKLWSQGNVPGSDAAKDELAARLQGKLGNDAKK